MASNKMTGTTIPYDNMSTASNPKSSTPFFNKCCFCIPIRMGCFILGYLSLLINIIHCMMYIAVVTYLGIATYGFDHFDSPQIEDMDEPRRADMEVLERSILKRIELVMVIVILVNFVWLVITIACLVGLHKKRPGPVRMYAAFASVKLLLSLAACIFLMTTNKASTETAIAGSFDFVENLGPWGPSAHLYIKYDFKRLVDATGDPRVEAVLAQRASVAIHRGYTAGFLGALPRGPNFLDLALAAYFILVYYVYSVHLEREEKQRIQQQPESVNNLAFIDPNQVEKILVA